MYLTVFIATQWDIYFEISSKFLIKKTILSLMKQKKQQATSMILANTMVELLNCNQNWLKTIKILMGEYNDILQVLLQ